MARQILKDAIHCPFCGCTKIFLKAERVGDASCKRIRAAGQCSRCNIRGPFVYTAGEVNELKNPPSVLDGMVDDEFIQLVLTKWNTRCP